MIRTVLKISAHDCDEGTAPHPGVPHVIPTLKAWIVSLTCLLAAFAMQSADLPSRGICAHRGASATHPENTLPAFKEAARLGAHMIEFDVWLTRDGHPIVMHDATVNRTTDGQGRIASLTLAEIKQLDAGTKKSPKYKGQKVPTLAEALDVMPKRVWLNIHVKEGAACSRAVAIVLKEKARVGQAFMACSIEAAKAAREILPTVKLCCMDRQYGQMDKYVETAIAAKADFIQLVGTIPPNFPELISRLKANNIRINYFGIEDPAGLRNLFHAGVDFPLVDDTAAGLDVAQEFGIKPVPAVSDSLDH